MTQLERLKEIQEIVRSLNIEMYPLLDRLVGECIEYEEKQLNLEEANILLCDAFKKMRGVIQTKQDETNR